MCAAKKTKALKEPTPRQAETRVRISLVPPAILPTDDMPTKAYKLGRLLKTDKKIIDYLGIDEKTYLSTHLPIVKVGRQVQEDLLTQKQFEKAESNPAMLIWLGKNHLGQHEPESTMPETSRSAVQEYVEMQRKTEKDQKGVANV